MFLYLYLLLTIWNTSPSTPCLDLQASAGYAVTYAKRSLKADNFDHQQYYAERSMQALETVAENLDGCACPDAVDPLLDAQEDLNRALEAQKWEQGRFYSQRALEHNREMIGALDHCNAGK